MQQMGQTVDQYRDSLRPQAEIMAKRNLLISEIFRKEGITVGEDDIDQRIDNMLGTQATSEVADTVRALRDMMKSGSGRAVLESQILQENSIKRLLAIVRGEELPALPEPAAEASAESTPEAASEEATTEADATAEAATEEAAKDESAA